MLAGDVQKALEVAVGFPIVTVRVINGVFTPEAFNGGQQVTVDAALPGVLNTLQAAETADITTYNDLKNGVQAIINRLDAGIAAVATDQTDLTAAGNLAAAKPIISRILNRQDALYTDLKKVIKRLELLTR